MTETLNDERGTMNGLSGSVARWLMSTIHSSSPLVILQTWHERRRMFLWILRSLRANPDEWNTSDSNETKHSGPDVSLISGPLLWARRAEIAGVALRVPLVWRLRLSRAVQGARIRQAYKAFEI